MIKIYFLSIFLLLSVSGFSQKTVQKYENGIKRSKEHYKNGKFHGTIKHWHPNQSLMFKGSYKNGVAVGTHTEFYDNTKRRWETRYNSKGEPIGLYKEWYDNGKIKLEGQYEKGKAAGVWKYYNEEGKVIKEDIYNDGALVETRELK